jgi:DNA polymerase III sliding clamp (beta) subunit (PCNA family)
VSKPKLVFETSTLASAVAKAARVAPSKGASYDKAAGIVIEVNEDVEHPITVKSTDLEVTILEWITALTIDTAPVVLRLPSKLLHGVVSGFPLASETTITIEDKFVTVTCQKKRVKIMRIDAALPYPLWEPFDPTQLEVVKGFSKRVSQVTWSCDRDAIPLSGVHMNGEHLIATDRFKAVRVPCPMPVEKPITVPLGVLGPIFRNLSDASVASVDDHLLIMPDEYTQITSNIYTLPFVDLSTVFAAEYDGSFVMDRQAMADTLSSMMVMCRTDHFPRVRLTIGNGAVGLYMAVAEGDTFEDEIEVSGADHEPIVRSFTPTYITDAMSGTDAPEVTFEYSLEKNLMLARISSDAYQAWISPRK